MQPSSPTPHRDHPKPLIPSSPNSRAGKRLKRGSSSAPSRRAPLLHKFTSQVTGNLGKDGGKDEYGPNLERGSRPSREVGLGGVRGDELGIGREERKMKMKVGKGVVGIKSWRRGKKKLSSTSISELGGAASASGGGGGSGINPLGVYLDQLGIDIHTAQTLGGDDGKVPRNGASNMESGLKVLGRMGLGMGMGMKSTPAKGGDVIRKSKSRSIGTHSTPKGSASYPTSQTKMMVSTSRLEYGELPDFNPSEEVSSTSIDYELLSPSNRTRRQPCSPFDERVPSSQQEEGITFRYEDGDHTSGDGNNGHDEADDEGMSFFAEVYDMVVPLNDLSQTTATRSSSLHSSPPSREDEETPKGRGGEFHDIGDEGTVKRRGARAWRHEGQTECGSNVPPGLSAVPRAQAQTYNRLTPSRRPQQNAEWNSDIQDHETVVYDLTIPLNDLTPISGTTHTSTSRKRSSKIGERRSTPYKSTSFGTPTVSSSTNGGEQEEADEREDDRSTGDNGIMRKVVETSEQEMEVEIGRGDHQEEIHEDVFGSPIRYVRYEIVPRNEVFLPGSQMAEYDLGHNLESEIGGHNETPEEVGEEGSEGEIENHDSLQVRLGRQDVHEDEDSEEEGSSSVSLRDVSYSPSPELKGVSPTPSPISFSPSPSPPPRLRSAHPGRLSIDISKTVSRQGMKRAWKGLWRGAEVLKRMEGGVYHRPDVSGIDDDDADEDEEEEIGDDTTRGSRRNSKKRARWSFNSEYQLTEAEEEARQARLAHFRDIDQVKLQYEYVLG